MTSSEQLTNGNEEDPSKSEGHIELRIANLSGFVQEQEGSQRLSDPPVYVRGVPWEIRAIIFEYYNGKYLGFFLQCNNGSTDPLWSCSATAQLRILAQREGSLDYVREICHFFHAKENDWGFARCMTIEDLMDPDNGWYDEQADCITLAVDFKAEAPKGVGEYVVISENELKMDKATTSSFSMQIGHLEWEFISTAVNSKSKLLTVRSKNIVEAGKMRTENNSKVALELFGYHRDDPAESEAYSPFPTKSLYRHYFTAKDDSLMMVKFPNGCDNILFTVRMLKQRSQFPDFTKPTALFACIPADIKLRVDEHTFHANKLLLSFCSDYFDRMFNGGYKEANQVEIELKHEQVDTALFHDFLLVMFVPEVLPDSKNVIDLLKLAQHYQAEEVTEKCMRHLRICRTMPVEQRVLLTGEYGDEESQAAIVNSLSNEESKHINAIFLKKMFTLYAPKK